MNAKDPIIEYDDQEEEVGSAERWGRMKLSELIVGDAVQHAEILAALEIAGFYMEVESSCPVMFIRLPKSQIEDLAAEFARILRERASDDEWNAMLSANAAEPWGSPICHSHDFCDANMAMDAAMKNLGMQALSDEDESGAFAEEVDANWNDAWEVAFKKHLSAPAAGPNQ